MRFLEYSSDNRSSTNLILRILKKPSNIFFFWYHLNYIYYIYLKLILTIILLCRIVNF